MKKRKKKKLKRFLCFTASAYLVLLSGTSAIPLFTNLSENSENLSLSDKAHISDGLLILEAAVEKEEPTATVNTDLNGMISAELIEPEPEISSKEIEEQSTVPQITITEQPQIEASANSSTHSITVFNNKQNTSTPMPLEEYVLSVLLAEMPSSYHTEALKAQAIACRTYAIYKARDVSHTGGADICTSASHCQAFFDTAQIDKASERYLRAKEAVDATASQIMLYDGAPILAVYHSSSHGMTSSSREVWGGYREYLQSVPTFEHTIPTFTVDKTYNFQIDDFLSRISSLNSQLSSLSYEDVSRSFSQTFSDSGRCHTILIGNIEIPASSFVNKLSLRSHKFDVSFGEDSVTVTAHGYGHGVGLSQMGAEQLAQSGYSCYDILSHYYKGVSFDSYS